MEDGSTRLRKAAEAAAPYRRDTMRALIERSLAAAAPEEDARSRLLANVDGPVSPALLELIEQPTHRAAVLLALVERREGWTVMFTERARHLSHHPGQISFPGGRFADSREDAVGAALREAWEEVRLPPQDVQVAGSMAQHITGTGFTVTPVVGFVPGDFRARPDPAEVASVFEVPLDFALDPDNMRMTHRERYGTRFRVYELSYAGHLIWGATAAMLMTFRELLLDE
jgi:8-oxo-dGTP pyrophosphatase MutT (NUDIX family)